MRNRKTFGLPLLSETTAYEALVIAAGGSLNKNELVGVNEAIKLMIASGAWSNIKEIWMPLGNNLVSALVKLKTSTAQSSLISSGFTNANYNRQTGIVGNGSGFLKTGFTPSVELLDYTNISVGVINSILRDKTASGDSVLSCGDPISAVDKFRIGDIVKINNVLTEGWANTCFKGFTSPAEIIYARFKSDNRPLTNTVYDKEIELFRTRINSMTYIVDNVSLFGYFVGSQMTLAQMQSISNAMNLLCKIQGRTTQDPSIVVFGDSIGDGFGLVNYQSKYATLIANNYLKELFNYSTGGRRLNRDGVAITVMDKYQDYLNGIYGKIDKLIIQMGVNDFIGSNSFSADMYMYETFLSNIKEIVNYCISVGVSSSQVSVGNLCKTTTTNLGTSQNPLRYERLNLGFKKACFETGAKYAEVYGNFVTAGIVPPDGIHPSEDGHIQIKNAHIAATVPLSITDPSAVFVYDDFTKADQTGLGTALTGGTYSYFNTSNGAATNTYNIIANKARWNARVSGQTSTFGLPFTAGSGRSIGAMYSIAFFANNNTVFLRLSCSTNVGTYITVEYRPSQSYLQVSGYANGVSVITFAAYSTGGTNTTIINFLGIDYVGDNKYVITYNREQTIFTVSAPNDVFLQACDKIQFGEKCFVSTDAPINFNKVWVRERNY